MAPRIEWHESIDSTMLAAASLADEGCESGTVVGADEQTAGQGRHGREWHSPPGSGLYFTVVLRLGVPALELPVVTLALGLALKDALELFAGIPCDLRWPNDVMINGRKTAGILTVLHKGAVLAGIGLNVSQPDFPPELRGKATSLALETGRVHDKQVLLRAILGAIRTYTRMLETGGALQILGLFAASSSYADGMEVVVDLPNGPVRGVTAGLTPEGFLRLRKEDGSEVTITAGGVRPAAEN